MLIIPDTNVLISAQIQPHGIEATILKLWQQRIVQFALSEDILAEYRRVLFYPRIQDRLRWSVERVDTLIDNLRKGSYIVSGTLPVHDGASDLSDNKFLGCAVEAKAEAIVSGDEKHLQPLKEYKGIPILSPRQFLEQRILQEQAA